ncbi:hypothetical protein ACJIZ3_018047 [Penstemon smallii]|uniref:Uncharacterized protein n=1 Tax=Penstemon smallii TaxID=265156 RepID=A0ABD3SXQ9_9LAMI
MRIEAVLSVAIFGWISVQSLYNPSPGVAQRIYYAFVVNNPTIPALRKEYGDLLLSCGLTGEAVKLYEDLELWDNLIHCYQLMDKKAAAIELINTRLTEKPSDSRLWCSLGDPLKSQEIDLPEHSGLWLVLPSTGETMRNGWFALGSAALKSRDVDKALDAFTRSFIAFKEALKLKRDSWQMWENYSEVAADIGNFSQAMEAIVQSGGSADSWGLYARWHRLRGDLAMCSEALLKQVRSYQGSDLWKDKDRFVKFAHASLELCKVYQELALRGSSRRELFAAEMHLKSTIKQAVDFSDTEEYRDLVVCLDKLLIPVLCSFEDVNRNNLDLGQVSIGSESHNGVDV